MVFLSAVVLGTTIVDFSGCFPFTALEVGDGPELITPPTTTLSVAKTTLWTSDIDPFCCGRGLINSNAARILERMTRDARRVRSTLGFARWLRIVRGPEREDNDGSESVSERPWTVSIAGS